jgi:hypothetical protein
MKNVKSFRGVYSHDTIPNLGNKKLSLIVNYDNYSGPGTHWICIYNDPTKRYLEFFDSYGIAPSSHIQSILRKLKKPILYNSGQIQSIKSNRCGWYCMDYIKKREQGKSPGDIIFEYKPNGSIDNDRKLIRLLE